MMRSGLLARRVAAYLVDMLVLFAILAPAGWLLQSVIGHRPDTGPEIWAYLLATFSLPSWLYFTLCESGARGATAGKRLARLRVRTTDDGRVDPLRALLRTAVKLLPWELAHAAAFGLSSSLEAFSAAQAGVLALAWLLLGVWLVVAARSGGRSGVHDRIAGTRVEPAPEPAAAPD